METRAVIIRKCIDEMPEGAVFPFEQLWNPKVPPKALALIVSRLANRGVIQRLSKGLYSKPRQTQYGSVLPSDSQLLELVLKSKNNKITGYVSGVAAYNRLGLTTQVANEVLVVGPTSSRRSKIGKLRIRFVRSNAPINEKTKDLLPLLDALRDAKKIPDTNVDEVVTKILTTVKNLTANQKNVISSSATDYPPRVRALLGAILELSGERGLAKAQKATLNPLSSYSIGVSRDVLTNSSNWNIE